MPLGAVNAQLLLRVSVQCKVLASGALDACFCFSCAGTAADGRSVQAERGGRVGRPTRLHAAPGHLQAAQR
eukprot:4092735-Pleurochrysis_carterae.AAC.1